MQAAPLSAHRVTFPVPLVLIWYDGVARMGALAVPRERSLGVGAATTPFVLM